MVKKLVFSILLLSLFTNSWAAKVSGVIILPNDTFNVTLHIPVGFFSKEVNFYKLQQAIKYYDEHGKRITLLPSQVVEYRFTYEYTKYRMVSVKRSGDLSSFFESSSFIFLQLIVDGRLQVFNYQYKAMYATPGPSGMPGSPGMSMQTTSYNEEKYLLRKKGGELKWPKGMFFRKNMIEYFADCPALAEKIKNKEFDKGSILSIASHYNSFCK